MHRLLVRSEELSQEAPVLSKDAAAHLRVLRPKEGERFELFDGRGHWRVYSYVRDGRGASPFLPVEPDIRSAPRPLPLVLFACVTKGARWDWTVEKATELGVTRLVPVLSDRTIVRVDAKERAAKRERWMRIAEDAARQSDAKWVPEILAPVTFAESLSLVKETACLVGALSTPPPQPIGVALAAAVPSGRPFAVYVGPEGDFTPEELSALTAVATPVSFGTTILRAETAAIYGISAIKAFLDSSINLNFRPQP